MKKVFLFAFLLQILSSVFFNYSIYILSKEKVKLNKEAVFGILIGLVVTSISFLRWISLVN
jgi:uncharacterized membrane protein YagU involved in acid resistance